MIRKENQGLRGKIKKASLKEMRLARGIQIWTINCIRQSYKSRNCTHHHLWDYWR
jgi:hypothetical protein